MPLDAVCLTALLRELAPELEGARIDKVQQPERDLLLLSVYTRSGARRLLISAGVGSARLHFTRERYENPDGTTITFDRDYLGEHRGADVLPGPFACGCETGRPLWTLDF